MLEGVSEAQSIGISVQDLLETYNECPVMFQTLRNELANRNVSLKVFDEKDGVICVMQSYMPTQEGVTRRRTRLIVVNDKDRAWTIWKLAGGLFPIGDVDTKMYLSALNSLKYEAMSDWNKSIEAVEMVAYKNAIVYRSKQHDISEIRNEVKRIEKIKKPSEHDYIVLSKKKAELRKLIQKGCGPSGESRPDWRTYFRIVQVYWNQFF